jgi:hypothetical protein
MRNGLDKSCRENQNIILCSISFFLENRAVYEIMLKNGETGGPQMTSQYGVYELNAG